MYAQGYNGPWLAQGAPMNPLPHVTPQGTAQHIMDLERTIKNLRDENYRLIAAVHKAREAIRDVIED